MRGLKNLIKRLHTPLRLLTQYVFLSAYIGMEMDLNINTAERRRAGISSYAAARLDNPLILSAVLTYSDAAAARSETEQRALMSLRAYFMPLYLACIIRGPATKRPPGKIEKINTSQAEPVAASSWAVGQFLSISCEAFR